VVVAALNDRAFALLKDDDESSSSATVLELMVAKIDGDGDAEKKNADCEDDKDDTKGEQSKSQQKGGEEKQKKQKQVRNKNQGTADPHEIQAVCSTQIESRICLAVSRENKTLSLYSVESAKQKEGTKTTLYPIVTYNIPKRARCLAFSSVPSSSPDGKACHVIIAGDLSGDAIAFPIPADNSSSDPASTTDSAKPKSVTRRLLLGHTASMLTGLNMVPTTGENGNTQQKQMILTADRDEKVRVTHFPDTHIVHGYLLGHSKFISSMDATAVPSSDGTDSQRRALCITGSGDGTVRLWDYESCKEVGMVPVVIKKCAEEDEKAGEKETLEEKNDEDMEEVGQQEDGAGDEEDFDEEFTDDEESFDSHTIAIPLLVTLGANAENVIVARDGIDSIDIHPIPAPPAKSASSSTSLLLSKMVSLHKKETLDCPSQPLAVRSLSDGSVLVLVREPDFIIHFQQDGQDGYKNVSSSSSPFSLALQESLKNQTITMPLSTMERDDAGEFKLQKTQTNDHAAKAKDQGGKALEDHVKRSGPHWNDAGRKEIAKLAEGRRRKRRKMEAIKAMKAADGAVERSDKE